MLTRNVFIVLKMNQHLTFSCLFIFICKLDMSYLVDIRKLLHISQPTITRSKLTIETLEQRVEYVQS